MPVATGTCGASQLAVSQTEVLLRVSEERLDPPSHRVQRDKMARWRVDLIAHDVLDALLTVFVARFFLRDQHFYLAEFRYLKLLRPDVVRLAIDSAWLRVDALGKRIDAHSFTCVDDGSVALDRRYPLFVVSVEILDEFARTVGNVEEIGVRRDTYLDALIDEFCCQLNAGFTVFLVESKAQRVGGLLVGVDRVNEVLFPDVPAVGVVIEFPSIRDLLTGFVREGVVDDDTITTPPGFVVGLEQFQAFSVEAFSSQSYSVRNLLRARSLFAGKTCVAMPSTVLLLAATSPVTYVFAWCF